MKLLPHEPHARCDCPSCTAADAGFAYDPRHLKDENLKRTKRLSKKEYEPEQGENSREDLLRRAQHGAYPFDDWPTHD